MAADPVPVQPEPTPGWGDFSASCFGDADVVLYGARTLPKRFEYVICQTADGALASHGVEVFVGSDLRLAACVSVDGTFRSETADGAIYVVGDSRRTGASPMIGHYDPTGEEEWVYVVGEQWGASVGSGPPGSGPERCAQPAPETVTDGD